MILNCFPVFIQVLDLTVRLFLVQNPGYWSFYLLKFRFFKCFVSKSVFLEPEPVGAELLKVEPQPEPELTFFTWSQSLSRKKNIWSRSRSRGKMARIRNTVCDYTFSTIPLCLTKLFVTWSFALQRHQSHKAKSAKPC